VPRIIRASATAVPDSYRKKIEGFFEPYRFERR
jgi:hypothetical protein